MRLSRSIRVMGTMAMLLVLATAAYAFTATNDVPDSNAGLGSGDVSGYDVTDITYTFDGDIVSTISFNLDPNNANNVFLEIFDDDPPIGAGTPGQVSCTDTGGDPEWECDVLSLNMSAEHIDRISVLASE